MTCTVTTRALTRITVIRLLRDGPRPVGSLVRDLINSGATVTDNSARRAINRATEDGAIVRLRVGWYGPAPVKIIQTRSERIYALLEERPGLTASEVSQAISGKENKGIYYALAGLEALGWARRTDEKPARWYVEEA